MCVMGTGPVSGEDAMEGPRVAFQEEYLMDSQEEKSVFKNLLDDDAYCTIKR